jgi:peptidyl-prolyl cis-trans isomerase-like 3
MALCASDYYVGCIFHRNIKGFIVQTGDPENTGKGGQSIWGQKFEDEFSDDLKVREILEFNTGHVNNCAVF